MSIKEWFTAKEIAGIATMPETERAIQIMAQRDNWEAQQRIGQGGGYEYHISNLPEAAQVSLLLAHGKSDINAEVPDAQIREYDRDTLWDVYERKTDKQKAKAQKQLALLNKALMLVYQADFGMSNAFKAVAKESGVSWQALRSWFYGKPGKPGVRHYHREDWVALLVAGNVGRHTRKAYSEESWDFYKADYLRPEKPSFKLSYRRTCRAAEANGWTVGSETAMRMRLLAEVSRAQRVFLREGAHAAAMLYPPQMRTVKDIHALEHINGDGYYHNVFVQWPNGQVLRPKTWFWQDIHSRKILGFRTDVSENTDVIRLSFGDIVENYGIPSAATIDNTRAAANKTLTGGVANRYRFKIKDEDADGIFKSLGIDVHWTSVIEGKGHGQAKPVERAFGIGGIGECVDKHPRFSGAYTGTSPMDKPDNYGKATVPLETFLEVLNSEIIAWNAQKGRRTEMASGTLSFDEVFNASYVRAPIRKATEAQRRLWLLAAESVRVSKHGTVTLDAGSATGVGSNRYQCDALYDYPGKNVLVRFDPISLHQAVHIYTLDGRYLGEAACIQATGFNDTQAARAHSKARKSMLKSTKEAAEQQKRMTTLEVADRLPLMTDEPFIPENKVIAGVFNKPSSEKQTQDVTSAELPLTPAHVVNFADHTVTEQESDDHEYNFQELMKTMESEKAKEKAGSL